MNATTLAKFMFDGLRVIVLDNGMVNIEGRHIQTSALSPELQARVAEHAK